MAPPRIRRATAQDLPAWLPLRRALIPDEGEAEHLREVHALLAAPDAAAFVAEEEGAILGFIEVGERPCAEGCETSPVAFIEAWAVAPGSQRRGVGRALMEAASAWARARGHVEIASDALLENVGSHRAHAALGFEEAARLVCFRRAL